MIKSFGRIAALLAVLLTLSVPAHAQLSRLKFISYKITSIVPTGLRSVKGSVEVAVRNDTTAFLMKGITGTIYRNGEPFVEGVCSDVRVADGESTVTPTGSVRLCDGVKLWAVLGCLIGFDIEEYTGDLSMTVIDVKGNKKYIKKEGLSVAEVLRNKNRYKL